MESLEKLDVPRTIDDKSYLELTKIGRADSNNNIFFKWAVGGSILFGINLFNNLVSFYIKPNLCVGRFSLMHEHSVRERIFSRYLHYTYGTEGIGLFGFNKKTVFLETQTPAQTQTQTKYNMLYGFGFGFNINIFKYIMLTAELNYDILPYKIIESKILSIKGNYKMLLFNFGIGFRF
jgi:hypothetical protein